MRTENLITAMGVYNELGPIDKELFSADGSVYFKFEQCVDEEKLILNEKDFIQIVANRNNQTILYCNDETIAIDNACVGECIDFDFDIYGNILRIQS